MTEEDFRLSLQLCILITTLLGPVVAALLVRKQAGKVATKVEKSTEERQDSIRRELNSIKEELLRRYEEQSNIFHQYSLRQEYLRNDLDSAVMTLRRTTSLVTKVAKHVGMTDEECSSL